MDRRHASVTRAAQVPARIALHGAPHLPGRCSPNTRRSDHAIRPIASDKLRLVRASYFHNEPNPKGVLFRQSENTAPARSRTRPRQMQSSQVASTSARQMLARLSPQQLRVELSLAFNRSDFRNSVDATPLSPRSPQFQIFIRHIRSLSSFSSVFCARSRVRARSKYTSSHEAVPAGRAPHVVDAQQSARQLPRLPTTRFFMRSTPCEVTRARFRRGAGHTPSINPVTRAPRRSPSRGAPRLASCRDLAGRRSGAVGHAARRRRGREATHA